VKPSSSRRAFGQLQ